MRTEYRNGDEITLQHGGCDGCSLSMINGVLCHETGCPDAWRDYTRECGLCGDNFYPSHSDERLCSDNCTDYYYN